MQKPQDNGRTKVKLSGWRLATVRAGLVACGLVLACLTLELGLRIVKPRIPTSTVLSAYFEYDAVTGWRGTPLAEGRFVTANFDSKVSHDAEGWRSSGFTDSIDDEASSSRRVVWCVGDSMTWGWGVSDGETFVDQLNRQSESTTHFRNLGIPGYSSVQEYLQLKQQFELGHVPDQVVVFFCGNDWEGNLADSRRDPPQPWAARHGDTWTIEGTPVPKTLGWTVRTWLRRNSLAFSFLNYHYKRARQSRASQATPEHGVATPRPPSDTEQQALKFVYGEIQALCREHRVELFVATDFWRTAELDRICRELEIPVITAARHLPPDYDPKSVTPDQRLTFATDPHWTPLGHALVARAIREGLQTPSTATRVGSGGKTVAPPKY